MAGPLLEVEHFGHVRPVAQRPWPRRVDGSAIGPPQLAQWPLEPDLRGDGRNAPGLVDHAPEGARALHELAGDAAEAGGRDRQDRRIEVVARDQTTRLGEAGSLIP